MATKFPRKFQFGRDTFAFANELVWEYRFDASGKMSSQRREPKPAYTLRCFVLTRAARQFLYHAAFRPTDPVAGDEDYRGLIGRVLWRNPRSVSAQPVV